MTATSVKQTCHRSTDTIDISPVGSIIHLRFFPSFLLEIRNSLTAAAPSFTEKMVEMVDDAGETVLGGLRRTLECEWHWPPVLERQWLPADSSQGTQKTLRVMSFNLLAESGLAGKGIEWGAISNCIWSVWDERGKSYFDQLHVPMGGHLIVSLLRMLSCFLNVLAQQQLHPLKMPNTEYTAHQIYHICFF